jgi:transketolase
MKSKLNPKMKLAKNLYGKPDIVPTRNGYGEGLLEVGEKNKDVVVLCADLTESTRASWFKDKFPDRFVGVGISEQDMMGIAAGLSAVGKIPFASSFGVFCTGRAWDQLRISVCYSDMNVKIAGSHGGISVGADGATHHSLEEITLTRVLPNMRIVVPCDAIEARKATIESAKIKGPVFLRFGREKVPIITTEQTPFKIGKAETFRFGNDITILACGHMVYESLIAAKNLEKKKINARVINLHTIKPIDKKAIVKAAKETGCLVTAEEHQIHGGVGSAISEIISENYPVPIRMIGIRNKFGESGHPSELMKHFGLTSKDIEKAAKDVLKAKK